jgi:FkbM family methyltransferase
MLLSRLRKPVDTLAPSVGLLYRSLRDVSVGHQRRQTKYGFTLAGSTIMASEDYEPDEVQSFLDLLETHETVLDIGANVGFYSCLASSRGRHVVSFEPSPRNLHFLYENLWENKFRDAEVFPLGLAKRPGLNCLYGFGGIASFVRGWAQADAERFTLVPVTSLDTIIADRFEGQRLLIKLDVEGFELDVLGGAEKTLQRTPRPTWLVEVLLDGEVIPDGVNARFGQVFEIFWKHGYQCMALNGGKDLVRPADVSRWVADGSVSSDTHNFLFSCP